MSETAKNPEGNLQNTSDLIKNEIAAILKGMTIRFEIKVNDVVFDREPEGTKGSETNDDGHQTEVAPGAPESNPGDCREDLLVEQDSFRLPNRNTLESVLPKLEPDWSSHQACPDNLDRILKDQVPSSSKPAISMIPPQVRRVSPRQSEGATKSGPELESQTKATSSRSDTPPDCNVNRLPMPRPPIYEIGSVIDACCVSYLDESSPPTGFITRSNHDLLQINERILKEADRLNAMPGLKRAREGQLVLAKSNEDNLWYRAKVDGQFGDTVDVDFVDWGMKETVNLDRVRNLTMPELFLEVMPPCAVKVYIKETNCDLFKEFIKLDGVFKAIVLNYDELSMAYSMMLVSQIKP